MAIKPNPYKLVCPKCGFSKVVAPKSDALSPKDLVAMNPVCKKCGEKMERKSVDKLDSLFNILFKKLRR
ncbi:hypothetical protein FE243_03595 [Aliarcobacter thereius]|uniref:hypothetical protein n=1 Tax=Aliarcobacter thereius TaxID=544718 RepID=UPI0010FEF3D9|nr:hypothetical protein [Aliarcobacter thereius]TLT07831.1 hypothetical protein FE243_03595 [Aliarcobacter thereius]